MRRQRPWLQLRPRLDLARLVFIDEPWVKTNMAPLRGWGPRERRLKVCVPHGHWRTLAFLAALRLDGLAAPCVFDGSINGEAFRLYVRQLLLPELRAGDIVVMDDLGSQKSSEVRRLIQSAGARLWFLPPYSPDLNPIEQTFAKFKHAMGTAQERAIAAITQRTGQIARAISCRECRNCIANAVHASAKF